MQIWRIFGTSSDFVFFFFCCLVFANIFLIVMKIMINFQRFSLLIILAPKQNNKHFWRKFWHILKMSP